jgi:hypothetical protein
MASEANGVRWKPTPLPRDGQTITIDDDGAVAGARRSIEALAR